MADSVISYGLESFGRTYKTYLNDIYNLQLRLLKTIVPTKIKYKFKDNYENLFKYCKLLTVYEKVDLAIVTQYYNHITELRKKTRPARLRNLANLPTFEVAKTNNVYGQRVWKCMLPSILNRFPQELLKLIEGRTSGQARNMIKKYFIKIRGQSTEII